MSLRDFEALSFDCYGTLVDWEAGIAAVLRPWADAHELDITDEQLLIAYSSHEVAAEAEHPSDPYPQILERSMRALGAGLGVPVSDTDAHSLGVSVPDWPAFADSSEALRRLARRFKLIILSNVDRPSFAASNERLGVTFTSIITAQDVGSYKPSKRNFQALEAEARRLGVAEGRLLHVAQSLFHDHVPAKRAGLPTVWINRRHAKAGWGATPEPQCDVTPDWVFSSMAALADEVDTETSSSPGCAPMRQADGQLSHVDRQGGPMDPDPAASADEEPVPTLRTVTGTVAFLERIALPPGAVVTVRIADDAQPGDTPVVLGQVAFEMTGQVPTPFAVSIDASDVSADTQLTVWARLRSAVGTWQSTDATPVPTDDDGGSVELIVRRTES